MKPLTLFKSNNFKILFYACLLGVTVFSIIPDDAEHGVYIPKLTESGFFLHVFSYMTVTALGLLAYRLSRIKIFVAMALYSTFLEGLQIFIPYRSFNYWDIVANFTGLLAAAVLVFFFADKKLKAE